MNKKQLNKIKSLRAEGVSKGICIHAAIQMACPNLLPEDVEDIKSAILQVVAMLAERVE